MPWLHRKVAVVAASLVTHLVEVGIHGQVRNQNILLPMAGFNVPKELMNVTLIVN